MKQILLRGALPLIAMAAMTGCIDDKYDLSDIDTTTQLSVKDLVLPINLEPITLDDIIDIKEGDQIQAVTINGETFYAVKESGTFMSDPVNIPSFFTAAPTLTPTTLNFATGTRAAYSFNLASPVEKTVVYEANGIDPAIVEITDLFTRDLGITLTFEANGLNGYDVEMTNVKLQMPKGLAVTDVNPVGDYLADGSLNVPSIKFENGKATLRLTASGINLPANDCAIDNSTHSLELRAHIDIKEATVTASAGSSVPSDFSINVDYNLSPLDVRAVSGKIEYHLEGNGLNISPVDLSNIPDFLSQEGTDLVLANPQIFLKLNNPVAADGLNYRSGLSITPVREGIMGTSYQPDNGAFEVGHSNGVDGPYNLCLSPAMTPADVPAEYADPTHVPFTALSYVISGDGIPSELDIKLINPEIYLQTVTEFELGHNLQPLEGSWEFLAPLAMKTGSGAQIIYTETKDGWNDDDVDAITIEHLEISMLVTNNIPLEANLSGYPIGTDGKQISGVTIEGATVPANAVDYPVTIKVNGTVRHLDGVTFTAVVKPTSDTALAPSQNLVLKNIRAKVSGNYTKEL